MHIDFVGDVLGVEVFGDTVGLQLVQANIYKVTVPFSLMNHNFVWVSKNCVFWIIAYFYSNNPESCSLLGTTFVSMMMKYCNKGSIELYFIYDNSHTNNSNKWWIE